MPEDQNIEWKQSWRDEYLKWICGFANAQGGRIYIGLDDNGNVTGAKDYRKLMEDIPNKVIAALGIMVDVNLLSQHGVHYLEINIAPSSIPVSYKGEYHYRCGSTKQILKGATLNDFLLRKNGTHWDAALAPSIHVEDLDHESFSIFKREAKRSQRLSPEQLTSDNIELLDRLHLIQSGLLTRAAVMLFYREPEKIQIGSYVKIGRLDKQANLLYHDEIHGSLFVIADRVIDLLYLKYLKATVSYHKDTRVERYPYPREAVREIVFNALVHNNWAGCTPIQIRVDDDCLRISNCCILPMGWTQESLITHHQSKPYNPLIAETFFRAGYIESWGRGIDNVNKYCSENKYPIPEFSLLGEDLTVTFYPDSSKSKVNTQNQSSRGYTDTELKVLKLIKTAPAITQKAIAEQLNISRSTVQRIIKVLTGQGTIRRIGAHANGIWEIAESSFDSHN